MKKQASLAAIAMTVAMASTTALAGDDIKLSGKVFFDYSNQETSTGTTTVKKSGGNVSRTYITAKKKIDKVWSAKVTIDSAYDANTKKSNNVFLKKAQLTGKFLNKAVNVKLGMIGTPWIGYEDKLGKHRHVSKSFADTQKLASSADAGVGVFGKVMGGLLSYDVVSINGGGYGNTAVTEKTDLEVRVGTKPIKGLTLDVGYRTGYKGKFDATKTENKHTLTQVLVTYGAKMGKISYRAGFNLINNEIVDELPAGKATVNESGTELWAWVRMGKFGGYIRNESWDNGAAGAPTEKRTVLAADYHVTKGMVASLVYDSVTDSGNTTGKDVSKIGMMTQFKF